MMEYTVEQWEGVLVGAGLQSTPRASRTVSWASIVELCFGVSCVCSAPGSSYIHTAGRRK